MLGLSNDAIIDFKQSEETDNIDKGGQKLIKKLKIKFEFYFILSFILLIAFWYYISMFDAVYRNTQFLLLKDTLIGFALSMVIPFVIYLIPGLFRIPALAATQENRKWLYYFSKLFTILWLIVPPKKELNICYFGFLLKGLFFIIIFIIIIEKEIIKNLFNKICY